MKRTGLKISRRLKKKGLKNISRRPRQAFNLLFLAFLIYCLPQLIEEFWPTEDSGGFENEKFSAKVSRVADGDSLEVKIKGKIIKIRLYGIDAPELHQSSGPESHRWLSKKILYKTVRIENVDKDQYDRLVALIFTDDKLINSLAVAEGQAWVYKQHCNKDFCAQMLKDEKEARQKKYGLWKKENPIPPWKWRQSNRRR